MSNVSLYYCNNHKIVEDYILKDYDPKSVDTLLVQKDEDKSSIGIDKIREVINFLQQRPYNNKFKYILIPKAFLLTTEAQNSLLKTLEEPPEYADIRLGVKAPKDLLETIVSRCKKINLTNIQNNDGVGEYSKNEDQDLIKFNYKIFSSLDKGKRIDLVQQISGKDKDVIIKILEDWVRECRKELLDKIKNSKNTKLKDSDINFLQTMDIVLNDFKKYNLNTKFILEYVAIHS